MIMIVKKILYDQLHCVLIVPAGLACAAYFHLGRAWLVQLKRAEPRCVERSVWAIIAIAHSSSLGSQYSSSSSYGSTMSWSYEHHNTTSSSQSGAPTAQHSIPSLGPVMKMTNNSRFMSIKIP